MASPLLHLAGQILPGVILRSLEYQMLQQMGNPAALQMPLIHGARPHPILKRYHGMGLVLLDQNRQTVPKTVHHRFLN